ncbi:retrovirus-related Pol polyprotein from transposon 17.6 [Trichonephila clavipes]|nr:retrovirus-related Pol polyprotein from transposon 17.6 [Trichonephila clavipes]
MKIITVNNYEDFSSDFPVSQDILPPLTEKDFNLSLLDSKIRSRLFQLLISHKSSFARSTVELSAATTEYHRISLQHDYPIKCPIYKIPFNLRNEFRRQIADLEKAGIISKSNSQYNTPALFVRQKEKWRLVLDFRKLNEITLTQDFVIPTLDDILHEISGSNYFSALDMKSAFNQIPLHFADRHKTAFSTPDGDKYQFNRLCFGLKNSPKAFQSIAQEVLGDLLHHGALVYIDDIILFTKTIDEHFELLGFVVTPEGILIDKDKSVSINEFPVPKDQKQIKSFLGCCNFYRRYIKNFAKRALPLTNLLRKDTPFEWTSETQEAFDDIKKAILNPPVLALPDQSAELQITTDASSRGIGAVLEQRYPNSEVKPLYFFSKKLNPSQSKYNATVLEFFAIYTALNFFRPFLLGRKFKVFTDHKPLAGFLSNKNPSSKILRWKLALEEFNYDIHYIRGSLNSVADHLSRYINNWKRIGRCCYENLKLLEEDWV